MNAPGAAVVEFSHVQDAHQRLRNIVLETPLEPWPYLQNKLGHSAPIFLKLETIQHTGSFKVRGASNRIFSIPNQSKPIHVVAASAGNHAQGVAYACRARGLPSTVFMPASAPLTKMEMTRSLGSRVECVGSTYHEAYLAAKEFEASLTERGQEQGVFVHAFDDPLVMAGQGTVGIEIHEQLQRRGVGDSDIQVVVPLGGGGLLAGMCLGLRTLRSQCEIFGVVSESAPVMAKSFATGRLQDVSPAPRTIAEGLAIKSPSSRNFEIIKKNVKDVVAVSDTEVAIAIYRLMDRAKLIVEGAGAAGLAAILSQKIQLNPKRPTVIVLSGGNIDLSLISTILERAFVDLGRWLRLRIKADDRPGVLARITTTLSQAGANVLNVTHDRQSPQCNLGETFIDIQLETRGATHAGEIQVALQQAGFLEIEVQKS